MKTKELIKSAGLKLFNTQGVMQVTLRDVAKALNKSYGNITYHFPKKEDLIIALYFDMVKSLQPISKSIFEQAPNLISLLKAPATTFDISSKYVFLFKDYVALIRNYAIIAQTAKESNRQRKESFLEYLLILQEKGYLQASLNKDDLDYLMELSGAMRTFFFLQNKSEHLPLKEQKSTYINYVNKLLFPYLSEKGQKIYRDLEANNFCN